MKTRLNCSVPGEYPFYFDEIQAISDVIENGSTALIYAVFSTSTNAISGSAICAFSVDDIFATFEGRFKSQKDSQSNWLPIQNEQVPEPRPGQCVDDSRMLSSTAVNFVKNHPLMEDAVPALYGRPLLTKVNLHHRLTSIAVELQVKALNGELYDIIYAGTDDGKITKFINIPTSPSGSDNKTNSGIRLKTVLISELQVLPVGVPVRELLVASKTNSLIVVSDSGVVAVPLHHCVYVYDCQSCLSQQDPKCAWDLQNRECKMHGSNKFGTKAFVQSLNGTKKAATALCPKANNSKTKPTDTQNSATVDLHSSAAHPSAKNDDESNLLGMKGTAILEQNGAKLNIGSDADVPNGDGEYMINGFNNDNQITLTSMPDDLMNSINDPLSTTNDAGIVDEHKLQLAGKSFNWVFSIIVVLLLVFIIGMVFGLYMSRFKCKTTPFHANHRNQLSTPRPFTTLHHHHRNGGKDVNLLVNSNPFMPCNQKKQPNVDIVGEKDRSHECKNSTENLEKEIPCKTSTLTKVKRTYI